MKRGSKRENEFVKKNQVQLRGSAFDDSDQHYRHDTINTKKGMSR